MSRFLGTNFYKLGSSIWQIHQMVSRLCRQLRRIQLVATTIFCYDSMIAVIVMIEWYG